MNPLQKLVDEQGSVLGDGKPFFLWLDLKGENLGLSSALFETLSQYSMLTTFTDDYVEQRAVVVVLTGDALTKLDFVETYPYRYAIRDSTEFHAGDPDVDLRWGYYSLDWGTSVSWDGKNTIPSTAKRRLKALVNGVHSKGKKVRFWNVPNNEGAWKEAFAANVDFVSTDFLRRMRNFIQSK